MLPNLHDSSMWFNKIFGLLCFLIPTHSQKKEGNSFICPWKYCSFDFFSIQNGTGKKNQSHKYISNLINTSK